jgi:Post-segregation antitoxin CcdA
MLEITEHRGEKQKLTLGIDKEVIERAKAAGINISAITEQLLKSVTDDPKDASEHDVKKAYEELFRSTEPLIKKYDLRVDVGFASIGEGDDLETYDICLGLGMLIPEEEGGPLGELWKSRPDGEISPTSVSEEIYFLYEPKKILENLILAMLGNVQKNKEKIRELELAKRFVKVLSDT